MPVQNTCTDADTIVGKMDLPPCCLRSLVFGIRPPVRDRSFAFPKLMRQDHIWPAKRAIAFQERETAMTFEHRLQPGNMLEISVEVARMWAHFEEHRVHFVSLRAPPELDAIPFAKIKSDGDPWLSRVCS